MIDYGTLQPPARGWDDAEDDQLRAMFEDGWKDEKIADELGRSSRSVANRRYRLGLTARSRGKSTAIETLTATSLARELRRRGWVCVPPDEARAVEPTCFASDAAGCE